jgi:hypothetical protein
MPMNGTASKTPTPKNMNRIILGRASGWREIDSTAFAATVPSPTAEPNATPEMMMPKEISVAAAINASGFKDVPF